MPSQGTVYETGVCLSVTLFALLAVAFAENISISLPPVLDHGPPPHILYNAGKTVDLPCKVKPVPSYRVPVKYEWYRNGVKIEENEQYIIYSKEGDSSLRISTSAGQNEAHPVEGYFQCKVSNDQGTAISNVSLLQAAVFRRVHRKERNETPFEGNPLKLPCDHMISIPPPTIRWVTVGCSRGCGDEQQITLDDRISIDDNGSLVFSHVVPEDGEGDRVYKCIAFNPIRRKHIGGSYTKIKVTGGSSQHHVPRLMYSTESPVVALQGSNVTLSCFFAGIPTPNVTWIKAQGSESIVLEHPKDYDVIPALNGEPEKSQTVNHTHHIQLTHVQPHHSGYYECVGQNTAGKSETTRIRVDVQAAPVIVSAPQSVNVSMGRSAVFTCRGDGIPTPQTQWYRNDQLINSTNLTSHWHTNEDNSELTIENTRLTDTSTIHCNVTNKQGSVLLGAYLLIYEGPDDEDEEVVAITDTDEKEEDVEVNVIPAVDTAKPSKNASNVIDSLPPPDQPDVILPPDPHGEAQPHETLQESKSEKPFRERLIEIVIPVGFLIIFIIAVIIAIKCKRQKAKRTYKVGEREMKLGRSDKDEYDSDDSGYPDDRPANNLVHHITEEEAPTELCVLEAVV